MVNVLEVLRPYRAYLSLGGYLLTAPVVWLLWVRLDRPVPWSTLPLVAFAFHPPVPTGLVLFALLSLFTARLARLARVGRASPSRQRAAVRRAYRLLRVADGFRARLQGPLLRKGVIVGHRLKSLQLRLQGAVSEFNTSRDAEAEHAHEHAQEQRARLVAACRLAEAGIDGATAQDRAAAVTAFRETLVGVPEAARLATVLDATFEDGPGFLSTLHYMYNVYFVLGAPTDVRDDILRAFGALSFDERSFGWLGHRVLETVIERLLCRRDDDVDDVVRRLQPVLDEVTAGLSNTGDHKERTTVKYRGRKALEGARDARSRA